MDPPRERSQVRKCVLRAALQLRQCLGGQRGIATELVSSQPRFRDQHHQLLLDAVMKVAFQAPPLCLLRLDQPSSRRGQLLSLRLELRQPGIQLGRESQRMERVARLAR